VKEEFYSQLSEEETMWNLIQSEIFVGARIEPFIDRENKVVHRLIEVREDDRGSIELGVGYNTEEKFKFDAGLKIKNIFGLGIVNSLFLSASEIYRVYQLRVSDNFFFTWRHFMDISLFKKFEFHQSFDLEISGFSTSLGYRPFRWFTLSSFYSRTSNAVQGFGAGLFNLSRYGFSVIFEKRDELLDPGNVAHLSLRFTEAKGDRNYTKYEFTFGL
jgi:outer membrane protein insertion porin family